MERRTVLGILVQLGSAAVALVVGIPALITALSPASARRRGPAWRSLGPIEQFPVGEVRSAVIGRPAAEHTAEGRSGAERAAEGRATAGRATAERATAKGASGAAVAQSVYVWRRSAEEVVVFSRSCTDLGCPVTWDPGSHCFLCPCHGGIFAKDGERMAGPPDRPLYRYANRVRDGRLEIDLSSVPPMV
ncbi:QcrA and Rieske domain-containing protein [Candidatus Laterigemmans baculatus]|uniref:QcrA and Rieske domain-containing protein n=1 Tax=Candidatus Laterigemmans baculatus TaxID=2770505 RepID=UPI0013D92393|nr:Rieske 2Fe-2S domain-containing protein [Candidatus Laterigemmans baculatus]